MIWALSLSLSTPWARSTTAALYLNTVFSKTASVSCATWLKKKKERKKAIVTIKPEMTKPKRQKKMREELSKQQIRNQSLQQHSGSGFNFSPRTLFVPQVAMEEGKRTLRSKAVKLWENMFKSLCNLIPVRGSGLVCTCWLWRKGLHTAEGNNSDIIAIWAFE